VGMFNSSVRRTNSFAIEGGRADIWQAHWLGVPPRLLEFLLELEGDHCPC
jgi:hypothetical protein